MKKFSEPDSTVDKRYAGTQVLRNRLYDAMSEKLKVSVNGVIDESLTISGKEELVEKFVSFIKTNVLKSNIEELKRIQSETKI